MAAMGEFADPSRYPSPLQTPASSSSSSLSDECLVPHETHFEVKKGMLPQVSCKAGPGHAQMLPAVDSRPISSMATSVKSTLQVLLSDPASAAALHFENSAMMKRDLDELLQQHFGRLERHIDSQFLRLQTPVREVSFWSPGELSPISGAVAHVHTHKSGHTSERTTSSPTIPDPRAFRRQQTTSTSTSNTSALQFGHMGRVPSAALLAAVPSSTRKKRRLMAGRRLQADPGLARQKSRDKRDVTASWHTGASEYEDRTRKREAIRHAESVPEQDSGPEIDRGHTQRFVTQVVRVGSVPFELFFALLIVLNSISLGIEVQYMALSERDVPPDAFKVVQIVFAVLFTAELLLRWVRYGRKLCYSEPYWFLCDFLLVVSSVIESALDVLFWVGFEELSGVGGVASVRIIRMIRITRLLRTFRIPRIIRFVGPLQTLVYSIGVTLKSLGWAMVLLLMIMYVYAILFTQAVHDHVTANELTCSDTSVDLLCDFYGDLIASTFTMFKSIAGGISWHEVIEPLAAIGSPWVLLFSSYIAFTYFAVLNVVTGVFCNSAIETAQRDPELVVQRLVQQKHKYVDNIRALFGRVDEDESGEITILEFETVLADENVKAYFEALDIDVSDAWELFKLIDVDGSNVIEIEEFVEGCLRLKGNARAIDLATVLTEQKRLGKKLSCFMRQVDSRLRVYTEAFCPVTQKINSG